MIVRASAIVTMDGPLIKNGAVAVEGNRIVAVGTMPDLAWVSEGPVLDLGDCALMPGLINAHCHLDYSMMRNAISPPKSFTAWVRRINALKRSLDSDEYLAAIQRGFIELRHEFGEGLDVAHAGRAPLAQLCKTAPDGGEVVVVVEAAFEGIDAPHPGGETLRRRDGVAHHRVVEMAVRVDEPRHERAVAEVDHRPLGNPREVGHRPDGDDAVAFDGHGPVFDQRAVHRDDSGSADDHG